MMHVNVVGAIEVSKRVRTSIGVRSSEICANDSIAPEVLEREDVRADETSENYTECEQEKQKQQQQPNGAFSSIWQCQVQYGENTSGRYSFTYW